MAQLDDVTRFEHMLRYAQKALRLSAGRSRADLDTDELFVLGITRALEIVGEAASRVSPQGRAKYAAIPWPKIAGMRNRLVHGYDDVDLDVLWQTIEQDLAPLISTLETVVPPQPPDRPS